MIGLKAFMPIAVAAVTRLCGSRAKWFALEVGIICHAVRSFCSSVTLNTRPKLDLPRVSHLGRHAIRPVFSRKRLLRFARDRNHIRRVTKIGDVAIEGGTPAIVLADTAVEQQVVPPSERTRAFYGLRSHGHLPKSQEKTDVPFRSANFSV